MAEEVGRVNPKSGKDIVACWDMVSVGRYQQLIYLELGRMEFLELNAIPTGIESVLFDLLNGP